ncbi:MAG: HlyD family efflux transporter periplasmic adaptor subunit, partial [Candidatus Parcubacteria bacterium]|nr:HlyD family efflux transporter periplasmic adaptor subunit [Candidatus Parcubacteria bacterium]
MLKNLTQRVFKHKKTSIVVIVLILILGYFGVKALSGGKTPTRYVLGTVSKGTLIASVSGTGQVSASNQVDIKAKVSGDVVYADTAALGQNVKAGTLLVQLDSSDAQKSVRDAQANLESAQLSFKKLQQPADQLSLLQAENSLVQAQESKQKAQDSLAKAYDDGFNSVSNAFLDLPGIISGLHDALYSYTLSNTQQDMDYYTNVVQQYDGSVVVYRNSADSAYQAARAAYDQSFNDYKSVTRLADTATIETLINETSNTTRYIAEALKGANNLIQFYKDQLSEHNLNPVALANTHLNNLNTYTSKTTTHLSDLLNMQATLKNDKQAIIDADGSIAEKQASLDKLNAGTDPLDLQSQELSLKQKQNSLADAQEGLVDCYIRAPFDGTLAKLDFKKGDSVSSGAAVATFITSQRLAATSLNEVDIAKIKVGQPATLTFDAIDGLSIAGQVAEVDIIGTVSQGVATYNVQISFDT